MIIIRKSASPIILNHTVDLSVEGKEGFTTKNHAKKLGLERLQQLLQ
jgi:hypothetical protein